MLGGIAAVADAGRRLLPARRAHGACSGTRRAGSPRRPRSAAPAGSRRRPSRSPSPSTASYSEIRQAEASNSRVSSRANSDMASDGSAASASARVDSITEIRSSKRRWELWDRWSSVVNHIGTAARNGRHPNGGRLCSRLSASAVSGPCGGARLRPGPFSAPDHGPPGRRRRRAAGAGAGAPRTGVGGCSPVRISSWRRRTNRPARDPAGAPAAALRRRSRSRRLTRYRRSARTRSPAATPCRSRRAG